ncbi:unnamed protein product [Kuraishia capsulata CBS 1993]|uniref:DNA repair protein RAD2 n=1 Tax=Kuraishia capsulata CBS 1993 TaxID=1382522 RepID=W6MIA9_9ASCO|nr:uncharacterized protein KUCA_T00002150001 [Kuraishia capsulata CBS 1993]CDK26179.1 unnamed protein product [Kuraishia capsulata CBS 1993]
MGVNSLWDALSPVSRPVRLESLSRKRLAVDASIWVYQFLKAVRDKDGNSLQSAHIVGVFRRICKLLYFGIFPVFVFDGGVPALKRKTIAQRRERREGAKESTEQAARRILAMQLQRLADSNYQANQEKTKSQSETISKPKPTDANPNKDPDGEFVEYFEDNDYLGQAPASQSNATEQTKPKESISQKAFRRQDEYHLPEIKSFGVSKNDKRVITDYEYKRLTGDIWDDLDGIDLDSVDPTSPEFEELPLETQYVIISHLRLRSRLRMGYTKEQLESLFPNSMDFSKFQIQMVQKRNFFTQKLMNSTGMNDNAAVTTTGRIAGEKDRAYTLQKNDDGWTLALKSVGTKARPIEFDEYGEIKEASQSDNDDGDDWEDVPLKTEPKVSWNAIPVNPNNPEFGSTRAFMDPSIGKKETESEDDANFEFVDSESEDEETKLAMIESLYDMASKRKQERGGQKAVEPIDLSEITEPANVDSQYEDDQMKLAIEQSKKEYMDLLFKEKEISKGADVPLEEAKGQPLIFSGLNFKNSILSMSQKTGLDASTQTPLRPSKSNQKVTNSGQIVESSRERSDKPASKPKAKPMPSWFGNSNLPSNTHMGISRLQEQTQDELAGLIAFPDMNDFAQAAESETDSEDNAEFVEIESDNEDDIQEVSASEFAKKSDKGNEEATHNNSVDITKESEVVNDSASELSSTFSHPKNGQLDVATPQTVQEGSAEDMLQETGEFANEAEKHDSQNHVGKVLKLSETLSGRDKDAVMDDFMFLDSEEEQLEDKLQDEEANFADFVNDMRGETRKSNVTPQWVLDKDVAEFQERHRKQNRDSDEVTTTMIDDVKELLRRFGIPYITAPMEAEAQCAELYNLGLVDGIITDDSDCFLFGGGKVYRNMFNEKNYVECYYLSDIERDLGLTREKLIQLALLLGSDYTEGIKGVGIVTAMEILAEFETTESDALTAFRDWWMDYQNGKIDPNESTLRKQLRKKFKTKLFLNEQFPDPLVREGYIHPDVDHDKTEFQWGTADLDRLRTYLMVSVGWNQERVDEILVPVIRNMNKQKQDGLQSTLGEFFPTEYLQRRKELAMGKRLKRASEKLASKAQGSKKRKANE